MAGDLRRSVLITRPEPGARETALRIRALGLEPVLAPLLGVIRLPAHLPRAGSIQAILATSGNAIAGLADGGAIAAGFSCPVLTVGDATAERAREAGFAAVTSAGGDATDLAALVRQMLDPRAGGLLLACGRGHGMPLANALRRDGFRVLRRTVYATETVRALPSTAVAALRAGQLRAVLLFSAETARQFVIVIRRAGLEESLRNVAGLAISASAGVAVSELAWGDLRVAARPNQDELLALLS